MCHNKHLGVGLHSNWGEIWKMKSHQHQWRECVWWPAKGLCFSVLECPPPSPPADLPEGRAVSVQQCVQWRGWTTQGRGGGLQRGAAGGKEGLRLAGQSRAQDRTATHSCAYKTATHCHPCAYALPTYWQNTKPIAWWFANLWIHPIYVSKI